MVCFKDSKKAMWNELLDYMNMFTHTKVCGIETMTNSKETLNSSENSIYTHLQCLNNFNKNKCSINSNASKKIEPINMK